MSTHVKNISAISVYGRYDFQLDFDPGVNILHGANGSGKTTLLHILANILNGEYYRFVFLPFNSITVGLDNDKTIAVSRHLSHNELYIVIKVSDEIPIKLPVNDVKDLLSSDRSLRRSYGNRERRSMLRGEVISEQEAFWDEVSNRFLGEDSPELVPAPLPAAYFPAFRTMIDAWESVSDEAERFTSGRRSNLATHFARKWFGQFTPSVNFPSLIEIEKRLSGEVQRARITIGRADRKFLSQAFLDIFESLSEGTMKEPSRADDILQEIKNLFDELEESPLQEESTLVTSVYAELSESIHELHLAEESEKTAVRVLNVYRELLEKVVEVQQDSFREIQRYLESVNDFLEGKTLAVDPNVPSYRGRSVMIQFGDKDQNNRLRVLSSGERQIATLIYAATHMSKQKVVLIDEPEISLHIDWQRRLLGKMMKQVGDRQIIACTHSPSIGADYEEFQKEIELKPTNEELVMLQEDNDEEDVGELPF
jgi:predicted ATP-binding protein involved in virulence